ncbi:hypothetical protein GOP47_0024217 [Adiantum capillus-veneris]|uniref:Uncharacterized protein n=1 Tax=Adiantum capillus-veneris TaxID=13818 RepID=A0A9D4U5E8_ADICA|nr:hypothetical protein GOP47_0024217 [Adiantum capillus-veneris]
MHSHTQENILAFRVMSRLQKLWLSIRERIRMDHAGPDVYHPSKATKGILSISHLLSGFYSSHPRLLMPFSLAASCALHLLCPAHDDSPMALLCLVEVYRKTLGGLPSLGALCSSTNDQLYPLLSYMWPCSQPASPSSTFKQPP